MARMYPEIFPGKYNQDDPEFIVYQSLRKLPDTYVVLYSKRFKGGLFGKPECEIDFIISNQRDVVVCLEVKGGVLSYSGSKDQWKQNGEIMAKPPDRQATEATHCFIRELSHELRNTNVDWALCFPQCSLIGGPTPPEFGGAWKRASPASSACPPAPSTPPAKPFPPHGATANQTSQSRNWVWAASSCCH